MNETATSKTIYVIHSYSDIEWRERVVNQLKLSNPSIDIANFEYWNDDQVNQKDKQPLWREVKIEDTLNEGSVMILLVSADLLESKIFYELKKEKFFERAQKVGLPAIPIIVNQCHWQEIPDIAERQVLPKDLQPLSEKTEEEIIKELQIIARKILSVLKTLNSSNHTKQTSLSKRSAEKEDIEADLSVIPGDPVESGLISLSQLDKFDLFPTTLKILARAISIAANFSELTPVSTAILFFSMIEEGKNVSEQSGTVKFLAELIQGSAESKYNEVLRKYRGVERIQDSGSFGLNLSEMLDKVIDPDVNSSMTGTVFDILEKAEQLSWETASTRQIRVRHLLAILINKTTNGEETGFQNVLDEMGISFPLLQDAFFNFVKENNNADEESWENLLFKPLSSHSKHIMRSSGYQADDAKGEEDWLKIDDDVNAFATLLASRSVSPPLSIGLFGEWGSGKTFFMRRLRNRVDELARAAQNSGKMQREVPFYKRIAQIEFNAWHYVESNLWASLVEHIFSNLRISGEDSEETIVKLQEHLLKNLKLEKTAEQQAAGKADKAQKELTDVETELTNTQRKLEEETRTLKSIRGTDVLAAIELPEAEQNEINQILEELNINKANDETVSFVGALDEARAVLERGTTLFTPLIKARDRGRRLLWLVVCLITAPAIGVLIVLFRQHFQKEWISESVTILGGIATLLASGAAWIRGQVRWVSVWISRAEKAKQAIDAKIAERQAKIKAEISLVEKQIEISKLQYECALREKEAAARRVREAEAELEEATSGRLLAKFIQDRVNSDDYRKHLGILALVRDDFERLSNFIDIENRRLVAAIDEFESTKLSTPKKLSPFANIKEEDQDKDIRINRVILYIDDLDRCPPNKVVDVLQAVHLLLAFPLFIVIVGVDARWITRSLESRYKELLDNSSDNVPNTRLIDTATPDDYLEKIFQIPFWLNPLDQHACKEMVSGLLKNNLVKNLSPTIKLKADSKGDNKGNWDTKETVVHQERTNDKFGESRDAISEIKIGEITSVPSNTQDLESVAAEIISKEQQENILENLLDQQHLEIFEEEEEFIIELTPLLGRSPRAIKRFINIYRLIKAGMPEEELNSFLKEKNGLTDFQVVLFLLAIDTGIPSVSEKLFQYFQSLSNKSSLTPRDLIALDFNQLEVIFKDEVNADWLRVKSWLESRQKVWETMNSMKRISKWIPRVARYSFQFKKYKSSLSINSK